MPTPTRSGALATILLIPTLIASACSSATPGNTQAAADETKLTIGVVELFANPFFAEARKGMHKAAEEGDAELIINNAGADSAKEAIYISNYLTRKVDAVAISAASPTGSLASVRRIHAAGIPVICYDTCINPPDDTQLIDTFVTSDNTKLGTTTGRQIAGYVRTQLGGRAKAVLLTCESFDVCKQRRNGLNTELSGVEVTILDQQEGFQVDKATPIATAMLAAYPDTQVFIAENEDAIIAAANAVKARGLTGKVAIFGIDINPIVARLITDPTSGVKWTTGQDPYQMGYKAIQAAVNAARGKPVGPFFQYTPQPTFSSADPSAARAYLQAHPN